MLTGKSISGGRISILTSGALQYSGFQPPARWQLAIYMTDTAEILDGQHRSVQSRWSSYEASVRFYCKPSSYAKGLKHLFKNKRGGQYYVTVSLGHQKHENLTA